MARISDQNSATPGVRWLGLSGRLLLAFLGIAVFAVLAAGAGLHAFREVGQRLALIDMRVPSTVSALELAQLTERIVAVAPELLAATDQDRQAELRAGLTDRIADLKQTLDGLAESNSAPNRIEEAARLIASLAADLAELDSLVTRKLSVSAHLNSLRRMAFEAYEAADRLLSPWVEVTSRELSTLAETTNTLTNDRLRSLLAMQEALQSAQSGFSSLTETLAEASTTDNSEHLPVLAFQLGLALGDLDRIRDTLDPRLRPLFDEQVADFQELAEGKQAITVARGEELALVDEGGQLISDVRDLSARLVTAVDALGASAKEDIKSAINEARATQLSSGRTLFVLVGLSLLTAILIVWLYVGRNVTRRLSALSNSMLSLAGGDVRSSIPAEGTDEIAAMARVVDVLRRNTLERDRLLAEKAETAERLEDEVGRRTAEVREKSRQLEIANRNRSQFLAAASHDLRQPLHALNLFVARLRSESNPDERARLVGRVTAAVGSMNELFEALLDMSRLDAGVIEPEVSVFPVEPLLARLEGTFAEMAGAKNLRLTLAPSSAWIRSDFVLLERILFNLVANALRYTSTGGVVVGFRRRAGMVRIDVCDTGPGLPKEQERKLCGEAIGEEAEPVGGSGGLGLGLSIVGRLGKLLDHRIAVVIVEGRGSRISISVPRAEPRHRAIATDVALVSVYDHVQGKCIVFIDDDELVLDSMAGILSSWGCDVVAAQSAGIACALLVARQLEPDAIISDQRLADGQTGIAAIAYLRDAVGSQIPAFLISGDTAPDHLREARASGFRLLHKPVTPIRLRAMLSQLLKPIEPAGLIPPSGGERSPGHPRR